MGKLVFGQTKVSQEFSRVFGVYSEIVGTSRLQLAGGAMVRGYQTLETVDWMGIQGMHDPIHALMGPYPSGPARIPKHQENWIMTEDLHTSYLNWCTQNPVNIPGILDLALKSGFSSMVLEDGIAEELQFKQYSAAARQVDQYLWEQEMGGVGGCLDREPIGSGSCLDRGPNW